MSVYLRDVEINVGELVLYQHTRSLKTELCLITKISQGDGYYVTLLMSDGTLVEANRMYLRRPPARNSDGVG